MEKDNLERKYFWVVVNKNGFLAKMTFLKKHRQILLVFEWYREKRAFSLQPSDLGNCHFLL